MTHGGGPVVQKVASSSPWFVCMALMFAQMLKSGYHVVSKVALNSNVISPFMLCFARDMIALPLLFIMALVTRSSNQQDEARRMVPQWKDVPRFIGLGFGGIFANQVFFLWGLQYTSPTNASMMQPMIPVLTTAIALLIGYEKSFNKWKALGILSAVGGAIVMLLFSAEAGKSHHMLHPLLGNVFLIINCFGFAAFILLQRPLTGKYSAAVITAWAYLFGAIFVAAISARDWIKPSSWVAISDHKTVILAILYSAICSSAISFSLTTWANGKVQEVVTTLFQAAQPFWTTALSFLILKSVVTGFEVLGGVLILAGLACVCYAKDQELKRITEAAKDFDCSPINSPGSGENLLQDEDTEFNDDDAQG
eukprot:TRINITY_DN8415_c0_g1_i1.p1 TRINITY_DN8415_c0_g1~~TRINITY_DN8415_c0_g1_i1.p1  ORF type:complete len:366 (+),score=75.81 TRINITY_DN8415_c0_g1_i1:107-1204(+)